MIMGAPGAAVTAFVFHLGLLLGKRRCTVQSQQCGINFMFLPRAPGRLSSLPGLL